MEQRKQRTLAIFALALALIATSVAYAALQTTLTISGTVTKKQGSFSVVMQNPTKGATKGSGAVTSVAVDPSDSTKLNFAVSLTKPGDSASLSFDIYNAGSIAATANTSDTSGDAYFQATMNGTTSDATHWSECADKKNCFPQDISCTFSGDSEVITLQPGAKKTYTITCTYDANATTVASEDIVSNISYRMTFRQA